MRLLAQHGYGDGDRVAQGLAQGTIEGVIYSPRDISSAKLETALADHAENHPDSVRLIDPCFYASHLLSVEGSKLGRLATDDYEYFRTYSPARLRRASNVETVIQEALEFQQGLNTSAWIAPNILVSRAIDSREAATAAGFIEMTADVAQNLDANKEVYSTLAISSAALMDRRELFNFVEELTLLENPPTGFYLLLSSSTAAPPASIYEPEMIGSWMYLIYALSNNGFEVITGYSDLMSPLYGAAGASYGASGWWSNLRTFSMQRFLPAKAGRRPRPRYLSSSLWNRIVFFELDFLRTQVGTVLNGLNSDAYYDADRGSELTEPAGEVLQAWDALNQLIEDTVVEGDTEESLSLISDSLGQARTLYSQITDLIRLEAPASVDQIRLPEDVIEEFRVYAEL